MQAARPENEAGRLVALKGYDVLDTPPELAYDELSELAARLCGCPIAYISLVDESRLWLKSGCGLPPDLTEMPRDDTVCAATICQNDLVVVPDLTVDERFRDLPSVSGEPHLRFYCGMPLINPEGYALGTICAVDFQPRELDFAAGESLRTLSHQVAGQLELRRSLAAMKRSLAELERARSEIEAERAKSDGLLLNILPQAIARELRESGAVKARHYPSATFLFTDFQGFTGLAANMEPARLVQTLDQFFTAFDAVVAKHRLEKLKTIGDAYMCAGGVPEPNRTHPIDAALAALGIRTAAARINRERVKLRLAPWEMRIGLHTGPAMAGIVGRQKFAYDVWGDTVNIAARMEQAGEAGRVNISEAVYHRVGHLFETNPRGSIEAKNKGQLAMYYLERIKPELSADAEGLLPNERFHIEARRV
jgi:class 3 adenylate cyclase